MVQFPMPYCANDNHNQSHFYVYQTECFSAVTFDIGYEKNIGLLYYTKISLSLKNSGKVQSPFNTHINGG